MSRPYRILEIINDISSCAYYRNILPAIKCRKELAKFNIDLTNEFIATNDKSPYDCHIWSRIPAATLFPFIRKSHKEGVKTIWDLDDELWNIPEYNPSHQYFHKAVCDFLDFYLEISASITVSTENLKTSLMARYPIVPSSKVVVLENLITSEQYNKFINKNKKHDDTPFKIIWSGGHSHLKDVEPIKKVLEYYKNNYKVNIIMFGYCPDEFNTFPPSILTNISWCNKKNYEAILGMLSPHLSLIPLHDCQFNTCKSAIKYFEMSLAGMPSIVSNTTPYKDVVNHCEDGLIAYKDEDWITYCDEFIKYPNMWEKMTEAAINNVISNFSWDCVNKRNRAWLEFFKSIPDL